MSGIISLNAQDYQNSAQFLKEFRQAQEALPRETVYLQTDRDWYYFGDRIWFSAFAVTGGYNLLSDISTVLYVELIEPDGNVAERVAVELTGGRGSGSINFENAKKSTGDYQLRAFTRWGKQFGESYIFSKNIEVLSDKEVKSKNEAKAVTDVQFLPEGGDLIDGISSRVAFKAIGSDGLGVAVDGIIYDDTGKQVAEISSEHLGMGLVELRAESGRSYYAVINENRYELPQVLDEGVRLQVNQDENDFKISIKASPEFDNNTYMLFAHVRGLVFHASLAEVKEGNMDLNIEKEKFPSGIVHFVLMKGKKPVSERLAFNKNVIDEVELNIITDEEEYTEREGATLELQFEDLKTEELSATASISIFDDNIQNYDYNRKNIVSELYLGSEINGYIEQPGYYFRDEPDADRYLDILLMSQGWRAFNMNDPITLEDAKYLNSPERGFNLTGRVGSLWTNKPLQNASVYVVIGDQNGTPRVATTNSDGIFVIDNLSVYGEKYVQIRANNADGNDRLQMEVIDQFEGFDESVGSVKQDLISYTPVLEEDFGESNEEVNSQALSELSERSATVLNSSEEFLDVQMSGELDEVEVVGKSISQSAVDKVFSDLGGAGTRIDLDERKVLRDLSMDQVLNQLPGVRVNLSENTILLNRSIGSLQSGPSPPLIIMDGMEVDFNTVRYLNTADVKTITVSQSPADLAILGSRAGGGAIIIETRTGAEYAGGLGANRGNESTFVKGYQEPARFYAPKYGVNVPRDLETPDKRVTLYWNPKVQVTEAGIQLRYWMNDVPSRYRIVVEGITENGEPFYSTETIRLR
ncbi:hypothetical protein AB2B38_010760 [Balneola sp. MJW-20]|uniref:hypothetical protein n=1 Tax=Gracilimonas aurantiaca TaxID=3234185 RepID=UPI0034669C2C